MILFLHLLYIVFPTFWYVVTTILCEASCSIDYIRPSVRSLRSKFKRSRGSFLGSLDFLQLSSWSLLTVMLEVFLVFLLRWSPYFPFICLSRFTHFTVSLQYLPEIGCLGENSLRVLHLTICLFYLYSRITNFAGYNILTFKLFSVKILKTGHSCLLTLSEAFEWCSILLIANPLLVVFLWRLFWVVFFIPDVLNFHVMYWYNIYLVLYSM